MPKTDDNTTLLVGVSNEYCRRFWRGQFKKCDTVVCVLASGSSEHPGFYAQVAYSTALWPWARQKCSTVVHFGPGPPSEVVVPRRSGEPHEPVPSPVPRRSGGPHEPVPSRMTKTRPGGTHPVTYVFLRNSYQRMTKNRPGGSRPVSDRQSATVRHFWRRQISHQPGR